ncbi:MAG: hypothetical protein HYW24_02135 [Candidatus Aenigmarchaeota archaeon]|nr:hypothetical protein [Candidatus Aenigmarchaeota archaeon]
MTGWTYVVEEPKVTFLLYGDERINVKDGGKEVFRGHVNGKIILRYGSKIHFLPDTLDTTLKEISSRIIPPVRSELEIQMAENGNYERPRFLIDPIACEISTGLIYLR